MRPTALALALACGATPVHAQDLSTFNRQVQLQIDQSVMVQTQDNARWQMDEMRRLMENSPVRWAQPRNDVIPPADPPADMTAIPTDGSIPTVHSAQYNGPITVAKTAKVLAIAVAPDHWQSPTAIGAYEIR